MYVWGGNFFESWIFFWKGERESYKVEFASVSHLTKKQTREKKKKKIEK